MKIRVVDTNVLVVANGGHEGASSSCQLASIEALKGILSNGRIVVDCGGEISGEYRRYCNPSGQPKIGDMFYREVVLNYSQKLLRVDLVKNADGSFVDFPVDPLLRNFDPSDRKFVAASVKSGAPVMNSTDSDWLIHKEELKNNGISIEFVCGEMPGIW